MRQPTSCTCPQRLHAPLPLRLRWPPFLLRPPIWLSYLRFPPGQGSTLRALGFSLVSAGTPAMRISPGWPRASRAGGGMRAGTKAGEPQGHLRAGDGDGMQWVCSPHILTVPEALCTAHTLGYAERGSPMRQKLVRNGFSQSCSCFGGLETGMACEAHSPQLQMCSYGYGSGTASPEGGVAW